MSDSFVSLDILTPVSSISNTSISWPKFIGIGQEVVMGQFILTIPNEVQSSSPIMGLHLSGMMKKEHNAEWFSFITVSLHMPNCLISDLL